MIRRYYFITYYTYITYIFYFQANCARSKNIILVKNLPTGTQSFEMEEIFKPYGDLGLVLMPPFGITAIIEFINSVHAKNAFSNLAYSKVKVKKLI